ncbi:MAG: YkgJ family cysteine cluster protein [Polyangiaceae bacterium]
MSSTDRKERRNAPAPRTNEPDESALLAELHAIYDDAAALLADWTCPASTECCRFGITGREPYVTSIELAAVERELRRIGGARSFRQAAPLAPPEPAARGGGKKRRLAMANDERTCPLLDESGKCAVYAARPLGCRTFFCERASSPFRARSTRGRALPQRELNDLVQRVRAIAAKHRPQGDLGRALTRALRMT